MSPSILSEQCKKCHLVETCDHKRMSEIAYIGAPQSGTSINDAIITRIINGPAIIAPPKVEFNEQSVEQKQLKDAMDILSRAIYSKLGLKVEEEGYKK